MQSNYCHICEWTAPSEPNLREHVLHCHPGQKNIPKDIVKDDKDWIYVDLIQDSNYKGYDWMKGNN